MKSKIILAMIVAIITSFIVGCAPSMQQAAKIDTKLQNDEGIIYGTVICNLYNKKGEKIPLQKSNYDTAFHSYKIFIGDSKKDLANEALLGVNATPLLEAKLAEPTNVLFTKKLKAQDYSLTTRIFFPPEMSLFKSTEIWFNMPHTAYFTVATGKITYIGTIVININEFEMVKNYPTITFKIIDDKENALKLLKEKNPEMNIETENNLMKW